MAIKIFELFSIVLLTLVSGMYWGPWLALTRSMSTFEPAQFLAIVDRLNRNMAPLMPPSLIWIGCAVKSEFFAKII